MFLGRLLSNDCTMMSDGTGTLAGPSPLLGTSRDRAIFSDVQAIFPAVGIAADCKTWIVGLGYLTDVRTLVVGVFAQVCIDWVTSDLACAEHDLSGLQVPGSGNILGPCLTPGESTPKHGLAWLQSLPSRASRCPQDIVPGFHGHGRRLPFTRLCHFPGSDAIAMQEQ